MTLDFACVRLPWFLSQCCFDFVKQYVLLFVN